MNFKLNFYILVTVCLCLCGFGCSTGPESGAHAPQNLSSSSEDNPTATALVPYGNPTSNPIQVPTIEASPSAMLPSPNDALEGDVESNVMLTITPPDITTLEGNIYLRTSTGISRFSLATEEIEDLISIEPVWDNLGFTLSPDRQKLAYWLHTEQRSELWITELEKWSPDLVFTISGIEHEWISVWWLNESHLLLEPGNFDQRYNFFVPVNSYLINIFQQKIEVEADSLIFGCSLAVSPQSNLLATWCPAIEDWADPQSYFSTPPSYYIVLESDGEYWLSNLAPPNTFIEFRGLPEDIWSWSYQETYAAFSAYDEVAKESALNILDAQGESLNTIEDDSRYYSSLDWSPNQKYLSFLGSCSAMACNKVFDIGLQEVVWTSEGLPDAENGTYLNWSFDSNYVIVQSEGLTVIDISRGKRIRNFKDLEGGVIIWAP